MISPSAGTVSSTGPSGARSTRGAASSGSSRATGSSSASRPSSTSRSVAAPVIGLVIEEMRKTLSRRTGAPPTLSEP